MFDLFGNINKLRNIHSDSEKKKIAKLLQTTPEALEEFEKAYHLGVLEEPVSDNLFEVNAKQAAGMNDHITVDDSEVESLIDRIVTELLSETTFFKYEDGTVSYGDFGIPFPEHPVTKEEILSLPESLRPQLSGTLLKKELNGDSYPGILSIYKEYLKEKNPQKKKMTYDIFRQGMEIQDLDPITYQIIAKNKNSIGHWFPELTEAVKMQDFFKIPNTTIIQVPLPLLQLTKLDYMGLTKTSLEIADRFCEKTFSLDRQKEYFIKTGVFSSKYDFRNAHIQGAEEVRTIGEYLLFIHFQASSMAHFDLNGRNQPVIYGPGTTVEWVCREFIQDKEQNPCIYKGLPLHTEYRVFIDADKNDVIGIAPYWDPDTMKKRFGHESDKDSPHQIHDYIIYMAHENILMKRFDENKDSVVQHIKDMLPDLNLTGQWSLDVMQNGNDFYIIDMALAAESALKNYVPKGRLHPVKEDWIPELMKRDCYK